MRPVTLPLSMVRRRAVDGPDAAEAHVQVLYGDHPVRDHPGGS